MFISKSSKLYFFHDDCWWIVYEAKPINIWPWLMIPFVSCNYFCWLNAYVHGYSVKIISLCFSIAPFFGCESCKHVIATLTAWCCDNTSMLAFLLRYRYCKTFLFFAVLGETGTFIYNINSIYAHLDVHWVHATYIIWVSRCHLVLTAIHLWLTFPLWRQRLFVVVS